MVPLLGVHLGEGTQTHWGREQLRAVSWCWLSAVLCHTLWTAELLLKDGLTNSKSMARSSPRGSVEGCLAPSLKIWSLKTQLHAWDKTQEYCATWQPDSLDTDKVKAGINETRHTRAVIVCSSVRISWRMVCVSSPFPDESGATPFWLLPISTDYPQWTKQHHQVDTRVAYTSPALLCPEVASLLAQVSLRISPTGLSSRRPAQTPHMPQVYWS